MASYVGEDTGNLAGNSSTDHRVGQGGGKLTIHEARYGWSNNIWQGPCSHSNGCKDVTDILKRDAANDELHVNPSHAPQYMNQHFWPETVSGPPICRKLAIRFSYDGMHVQEFATRAVPHETVCLHVTPGGASDSLQVNGRVSNSSQANAPPTMWTASYRRISTSEIAGCWACACFPMGLAVFSKTAVGDDELIHSGCLLLPVPLPFCGEHRIRIPNTNGFYKLGEPANVDMHSSESFVTNGPSCSLKFC
jgi:hypothetical protein